MYLKKFSMALLLTVMSAVSFSISSTASPLLNVPAKQENSSHLVPAQFNIDIGGSDKEVIRRLRRAGYSQIKITKSSFIKVRAEACLGPDKFKVTVKKIGMRVNRGEKIGTCRVEVPLTKIIDELKADGYKRIDASDGENGGYVIRVCKRGRRSVLIINRFGDILKTKEAGRCKRGESFADIRFLLRDEGYNRIQLVDTRRRAYIVEACRRGTQYRLTVRKNGDIARERRIGRCSAPINPSRLEQILERRGFDRIRVIDRRLPGYRALACRHNTRLELLMNRFGDIMDSKVIDECRPALTKAEIIRSLRDRGVNRINVIRHDRRGSVVSGCYRLEKMEYTLDAYGNTIRRIVTGRCTPPPRINQVLSDFRKKQKLRDVGIFVEGCRRGKLLRFRLNRFGKVIKQEAIGRCR